MAELAFGLFGGLGAGGGAAAATTAAAGFGSTALTILSGVATAGSVLMQMQAASAAKQEAGIQSQIALVQADADRIAGDERALRIKQEQLRKIGAARVAFAGSGLDLSSNQLEAVEGEIDNEASFETEIERANARRRAAGGEVRAAGYQIAGYNAAASARAKAFQSVVGFGIDLAKRG